MRSANLFLAFWAHSNKCQSAIYLLMVTLVLCLKLDEYMERARENFGHIQSAFNQLPVTSILCLKSVKSMNKA